jgi:threonylcarbamoyladenosine tRNA methylthiotransferase MtaB
MVCRPRGSVSAIPRTTRCARSRDAEFGYPIVIKADGLAAGKGVVIADDRSTAEAVVRDIMVQRRFGPSGERIVLEEFLSGQEASYFVLADGAALRGALLRAGSQTHLRTTIAAQYWRDGCLCARAPDYARCRAPHHRERSCSPYSDGMMSEGHPYRGFPLRWLMLTADGPKVIEFNVRFGDPEAQAILPMVDEDRLGTADVGSPAATLPSAVGAVQKQVHVASCWRQVAIQMRWKQARSSPGSMRRRCIRRAHLPRRHGAEKRTPRNRRRQGADSCWPRVELSTCIDTAYDAAKKIHFDGMQYRRDIGHESQLPHREVRHCDLRMSGESGRFLRHRTGVAPPRRGRLVPRDAELLVVNSCSVTATADQGTRQTIRRIVRGNPTVKVVVTGCYATRCPDEIRELPNVVRVVPNDDKDELVDLLEADGEVTTAERFAGADGPCGMALGPGAAGRTALTLRIQTGCDEQCSYCIIPSTRGAGRSRPLADIVIGIRQAVDVGYREIAITGVHLGSYGRDLGDGTTLLQLVRVLAEWPDDILFRISSLEPMDCTPEIVAISARSARIAPHFHLPLQHGSDEMLVAMRRPYTAQFYRELIGGIHESISTRLGWDGSDCRFPRGVRGALCRDGPSCGGAAVNLLPRISVLGSSRYRRKPKVAES